MENKHSAPQRFFEVRNVFSETHARPPRGFEAALKSVYFINGGTYVQGNEECFIVPNPHASAPPSPAVMPGRGLRERFRRAVLRVAEMKVPSKSARGWPFY